MESVVGVVTTETSAITGAVVSVIVVVSLSGEVTIMVAVVDSSFSPQEKMTKLKIMERIISICLTKFPNRRFMENYLYHDSSDFTRK